MTIKDYFLTQEDFQLVGDKEIKGYFKTEPVPAAHIMHKYYDSPAYLSHQDQTQNLFSRVYALGKKLNTLYKYQTIKKYLQKDKKVVDYGCGTGDFIHFLQSKSYQTMAYEPNEKASQIACHKLGYKVEAPHNMTSVPDHSLGNIMLWHVLEHTTCPVEDMALFHSKLSDNGYLIIALPNHASFDAKYYKKYWAAWDVPRHLHHFSKKAAVSFFDRNGFTVIQTSPLWLDAYFVSLLSQKFISNHILYFLKPLFIASLSNFLSVFNKNNSSIIYILQKKK